MTMKLTPEFLKLRPCAETLPVNLIPEKVQIEVIKLDDDEPDGFYAYRFILNFKKTKTRTDWRTGHLHRVLRDSQDNIDVYNQKLRYSEKSKKRST
jgi:hypothetical protein